NLVAQSGGSPPQKWSHRDPPMADCRSRRSPLDVHKEHDRSTGRLGSQARDRQTEFLAAAGESAQGGRTNISGVRSNDADNVADSQAMTTMTEAFGPAVGTFQWRDKTYGFALAEKLPCFKTRK